MYQLELHLSLACRAGCTESIDVDRPGLRTLLVCWGLLGLAAASRVRVKIGRVAIFRYGKYCRTCVLRTYTVLTGFSGDRISSMSNLLAN